MRRIGLTGGAVAGIIKEMEASHYRVQLGNREVQCDLEGLFVLVEAGRILADTPICSPTATSFQNASSLIELSGKLVSSDPWSAWDEMESAPDDGEGEVSWEPEEEDDDFDTDTQMMQAPILTAPKSLSAPLLMEPVLSEGDLTPLDPEETSGPESAEPPGKIIAFPAERTRRQAVTEGGYALAPDPPIHRLRPPRSMPPLSLPIPQQKKIRHRNPYLSWTRLGLMIGVGVLILLVGRSYVLDTAGTVLPPHPSTLSENPDGTLIVAASDPYELMESQLRSQMSLDLMGVGTEGSFEEALLIELGRVKLDVASVRVSVTDWAGRKRDMPQSAEFRVRLRSRPDELDRELAGVGLVIGKYIQRYSLSVSHFEVVSERGDGGVFRYMIDADVARRFYIQRVELMGFLESLQQ